MFSVPARLKLKSGLFSGNSLRGSFSRAEEVWIIASGPQCELKLPKGSHCFIEDSFELESLGLDLWPEYKDDEAFSKLKELVEACDGTVKTSIILEDSLLVIDPDYEIEAVQHNRQWTG